MESEVVLHLTVRGIVTPEQWYQLHRGNFALVIAELEALVTDRLTAREVTITAVADPELK